MPHRNGSNARPDLSEPLQVRLIAPHSGPSAAYTLSPVVTTTNAKPVPRGSFIPVSSTPQSSTTPTTITTTASHQDITALIEASDNPLEFFLDAEDSTQLGHEAFPTPDALDGPEDGEFFLDSGIEDSTSVSPSSRTVSPSQIEDCLRLPSQAPRQHQQQKEGNKIRRPRSPHPVAMGVLSNFLAPSPPRSRSPSSAVPIPGASSTGGMRSRQANYKPEKPSLLAASPLPLPWSSSPSSGSDSDGYLEAESETLVNVPAEIDDNDDEEYIHFLSGGTGLAGSGSFHRPHSSSLSALPSQQQQQQQSQLAGANPHSYPPFPEYVPLKQANSGTGTQQVAVTPRGMNPTYHRRGRSLKNRSRRGEVAHSGRWRWAAREPSPDVWSIEEAQEEEEFIRLGSPASFQSRGRPGARSASPERSFGSTGSAARRGASPASIRSDDSDDMGLKKLRRGSVEGEVIARSGAREVFAGVDDDGETVEEGSFGRVRKVRFALPIREA